MSGNGAPATAASRLAAVVEPLGVAANLARRVHGFVAAKIGGVEPKPVEWLWHSVVAKGDAVELSGPKGCGKSTFSFLFACAVLAEKPMVLCGHEVTPLPADRAVMLVNVEQKRESIRRKLTEAAFALGLDPDAVLSRIVVLGREDEVRFTGEERAETWKEIDAVKETIGLLILDSRSRVLGGANADSEDEQARRGSLVARLTTKGTTVLVLSHMRKSAGSEGAEVDGDDVAGHHSRTAAPDVVLLATGRKSPSGETIETRLKLDKRRDDGGEAYPEPMAFRVERGDGGPRLICGDEASVERAGPEGDDVLALLANRGRLTENAIRKALGLRQERCRKLVAGHLAAKQIRPCSVTVQGRKRRAYELTAEAMLGR